MFQASTFLVAQRVRVFAAIAISAGMLMSSLALAQTSPSAQTPVSAQTRPATRPAPATAPQPATSTAPQKDLPPAKEILAAAIGALAKPEVVKGIETVSVNVTVNSPMGDVVLGVKSSRDGKFLFKQSMGPMDTTIGFDGKTGWVVGRAVPDGVSLLDESQIGPISQQLKTFSFWVILDPERLYKEMETVDRIDFKGEECYKVRLVEKGGDSHEQFGFYSVEKKVMQGLEDSQKTPMGAVTSTFSFLDWKEIDHVKVYTTINVDQMGMTVAMKFADIEFNKLDQTTFDLPAEVKDLIAKKQAGTQPATTKPATQPDTRPSTRPSTAPTPPRPPDRPK